MSYQVLARKWRPKTFADLVGQAHVVRALTNALERGQLHHAYLFAGTRGVGKTTLARILSKALNCEKGVGPTPCGVCDACRELDQGRFIDLLEVDAASRTKVEQTRELLDNVPFAPVKGRFKVYLIDEVHMFSEKSFNALLKTLEEPPPHVKFLLATTDPQKLPVTVLSRCLQFNLKRLLPGEIQQQFERVLRSEGVAFEPAALTLLAHAADGSMRDGLSLLDQAIAFGGGRVGDAETRAMLGVVGRDWPLALAAALAAGDGRELLGEIEQIAELAPDFGDLLKDLLRVLHRVALIQQIPGILPDEDPDRARILELADRMSPEDCQLFYQIIATGQTDLTLAPDPRSGFEMVLLRALAFRPVEQTVRPPPVHASRAGRTEPSTPPAGARSARSARGVPEATPEATRAVEPSPAPDAGRPFRVAEAAADGYSRVVLADGEDWHRLIGELGLGGLASELASHCELLAWDGQVLRLTLDAACQHVRVPSAEERLRLALQQALGPDLRLEIRVGGPDRETPAQRRSRLAGERQAEAERTLRQDPVAERIRTQFGAQWVPGSIKPSG
ncbi:DNA polymerase III subunit gamma/tau [Thioalkalicoccus limnaeus]|uniref:DNA polymerase III subunit gamma/tau n=1 Tax=Thioalkalicoccus limnaeus TaxID=120681 RepID=A0ABV4BCJ3_9GAMM